MSTDRGDLLRGFSDSGQPSVFRCDADGNPFAPGASAGVISRTVDGQAYTLSYDAENRLVAVSGPSLSATFTYDGDGNRVKSTINGVTTSFVGNHYEVTGGTATSYYYAGASRVAMSVNGSVSYLLGDQLGSTSITTDANGNKIADLRYDAWGGVRFSSGTTPTQYTYTGQYSDSSINLLDYGSRRYDPELGRFIQPDSIVPEQTQGVQAWDRYAYANNNPVRYNDPSGHCIDGVSTWVCVAVVITLGTAILSGDSVNASVLTANAHQRLIAQQYATLAGNKGLNDLAKSTNLVQYAAALDPKGVSCFVRNVGAVVTGHDDLSAPFTDVIGMPPNSQYYKTGFAQRGFSASYQDPPYVVEAGGGNQLRHYWYYVQLGYALDNKGLGYWAVDAHENWLSNPVGRSTQDRLLGYLGINTGMQLRSGSLTPKDVAGYMSNILSPHVNTWIFAR